MLLLSLIASGCSGGAPSPTPQPTFAAPASIGFGDVGSHGSTLISYRESGYLVMPYSGEWTVSRSYGKPAPFILFTRTADESTSAAEIRIIADGGSLFRFSSVDLYSSVTPIPYSMTGFLGTTTVFTVTGTVPNTFGNFATVLNPHARDVIDGLGIRLSNPATGCCSNPVGLDNIVIGY